MLLVAGGVIALIIIGFLAGIAYVGWLFAIIGGLLDLYCVIGIILAILNFLKIV